MNCRNRTARARWTSGLTVLVITALITLPITFQVWSIWCGDHVIDDGPPLRNAGIFVSEHPNFAMLLSFNLTIGLFGIGVPFAVFLIWEWWMKRRTLAQWKAQRVNFLEGAP